MTVRAGVYCRISKDRKDASGEFTMLGVDRQEEDCRELCRTLGWEVSEVFVDNDVSATSGKTRPAYTALLKAVTEGTIDAIVCWHPDRLYRRTVDLEELVKVCDKHRAPVATVNAGAVDLTTPTGRLGRIVFGCAVGVMSTVLLAPWDTEFGAKVGILSGLLVVTAARPFVENRLAARASRVQPAEALRYE